ncbi:MAG: arsenite methyltransferase [bacterium]
MKNVDAERAKEIKESVRRHYTALISGKGRGSCCGPTSAEGKGALARMVGYREGELSELPDDAVENSFGCGNPLAFAEAKEGDVVLDLGSGAGIDVLIASRKVGQTGKVIGLDMAPEMVARARENAERAGATNVEFVLGEMEEMPLRSGSVDWVISNCVVNLSPDKERVFRETFRVLKPGGRILISDIVASGLPEEIKSDLTAWAGCVAGALEEREYLDAIRRAGFWDVSVVDKVAFAGNAEGGDSCCSTPGKSEGGIKGEIASIRVFARKPE